MMTCCKEKAVFVAVYEEKPRKRRLTTRNDDNIKHHHHHHHHHLHVHQSKENKGNRRAELLSYSQHLRESSKLKASSPPLRPNKSLVASTTNDQETVSSKLKALSHPPRPKSLVASTTNDQETVTQVNDQKPQKLKKQSSRPNMNTILKCFAMSHAKKKVKKKKKKGSESASKKANLVMKRFNARTQKGARRFFLKLKAFIQKHR